MRYHLSVLIFLILTVSLTAQQLETRTYEIDDTPISNPERGFYHHTEVHSVNYNPLNVNTLIQYRTDESITQILRVFYLEDFREKPISKEYLINMHRDFNIAREAGIKIIVRMAYSKRQAKPHLDATPDVVKTHIFQLQEIFSSHADVIAVIQTGFVGAWGEWYYTDHFAGDFPSNVSEENEQDRRTLVMDLLEVVPKDRMIQLRTPRIKMNAFNTPDPIDPSIAYAKTNITRTGHHNDCFVASSSDQGTYVNPEIEKPYLAKETRYLPMGGETCAVSAPYSDCENAYNDLTQFHWSYLNIDYNNLVLDIWRDQGCFDEVEKNLGYRYVLAEATINNELNPAGQFDLTLNLNNNGFASPYNQRNVEVILQSTTTNERYKLLTSETIGLWPIQEDFTIQIAAGFPSGIANGKYKVYLNMPDKYESLADDSAYAIRLANKETWIESSGYNDLGFELNIDDNFTTQSYSGDSYFTLIGEDQIVATGPKEIFAGKNQNDRILFWGKSENHISRKIERSSDGSNFELIANLPAQLDFYRDFNISENNYYRFALINDVGETSYSNSLLVESNPISTNPIEIDIDGNDDDWKDLIPTASNLNLDQESFVLRTHFDAQNANFALYGPIDNFKIYLNTDNLQSTGLSPSDLLTGMDYLIENGELFKFENETWNLVANEVVNMVSDQMLEVQVSHAAFGNLGVNAVIPIVGLLNSDAISLSKEEAKPAVYVRQIPAEIPANLRVENSINFSDSRLEVHWDLCAYCEGYILESSTDGIDFSILEDINYSKDVYYHDFLTEGIYYYRMKSYNILGASAYTEILSGTIKKVVEEEEEEEEEEMENLELVLSPNPSDELIELNRTYQSYEIISANGALVQSSLVPGETIDVTGFANGIYIVLLKLDIEEDTVTKVKFVKMK